VEIPADVMVKLGVNSKAAQAASSSSETNWADTLLAAVRTKAVAKAMVRPTVPRARCDIDSLFLAGVSGQERRGHSASEKNVG
jgi:hypothetical protein